MISPAHARYSFSAHCQYDGSYAFGFFHVSEQPEAAVAVLHNDVLPFYAEFDLLIKAALTDD